MVHIECIAKYQVTKLILKLIVFSDLTKFLFFFRERFTNEYMAGLCIAVTMAATLPSCIHLFLKPKKQSFILSLIISSLAFFLFSFQVIFTQKF